MSAGQACGALVRALSGGDWDCLGTEMGPWVLVI